MDGSPTQPPKYLIDSNKSLGQVAYETMCEYAVITPVEWDKLSEVTRKAWEAVANKIADKAVDEHATRLWDE